MRWHKSGLNEWSLQDWVVAVGGEVGEALNLVKKLNRDRDNQPGNSRIKPELLLDLADELADVVIYLDILLEVWQPGRLLAHHDAASFQEWRAMSRSSEMDDRLGRAASYWGANSIVMAGRLADCALNAPENIGFLADDLMENVDKLAWCCGIDLGQAVQAKFNETSAAYSFAERL